MHCTNCGNKIEPGEKFCPECGSELGGAEKITSSKPKLPVNKKTAIWGGIGVVALLIIAFIMNTGVDQSTPNNAFNSYIKAIKNNNVEKAIKLVDPEKVEQAKKHIKEDEEYENYADYLKDKYKDESFTIKDCEITGVTKNTRDEKADIAIVEYEITIEDKENGNQQNFNESIEMIKSNGKWYVSVLP